MKNEIHSKGNKTLLALIDIDETICFYERERIYENAIPNFKNIEKINNLYDGGWEITYWTARGSTQIENNDRLDYLRTLTLKQLKMWGAKFNNLEIGDKKPLFDLIVDDKAKRIEEL
jgi:hypothetical protein